MMFRFRHTGSAAGSAALFLASLSLVLSVCAMAKPPARGAASSDAASSGAVSEGTGDAAPVAAVAYEAFTLDNGLRVIVHEDRKAPIVAVGVWYHVGSKDEPAGKTGFAHLFEHLMFNGSENYDGEWFLPLEEAGATNLNGTTWFDRTNYYQTVPTPALERVLWMESDRMGHLLGAITQEKLDNQRGVVQNEKRQGDNRPYGKMEYAQLAGLLPPGHPYRHSTIGSIEDLNAASLTDVKSWFQQYYGAANAVLVLSGDIDKATAQPLIEKYFGHIAAGPALTKKTTYAPRLAASRAETMYDDVPQPRLSLNWVSAPRHSREAAEMRLAAIILGGGKTSRLYRALVDEARIATSASAFVQEQELMSFFEISIDTKTSEDIEAARAISMDIIAEFLEKGPTKDEVERAQTRIRAGHVRALERVHDKAALLAQGALYMQDPGFYFETRPGFIAGATPKAIRAAAQGWLRAGSYQLTVLPEGDFAVTESPVDRSSGLPGIGESPQLNFPGISRDQLSNGVGVILATRDTVPTISVAVQFDAGFAADNVAIDDTASPPGLAQFTMGLLDEGTESRNAQEIASSLEGLGASLATGAGLDTSFVSLTGLKDSIAPALDIMADVIKTPAFAPAEIEKARARMVAGIENEKANPVSMALRVLPPVLYGDQHVYGLPFTGSGDVESVTAITRDDLARFHAAWHRPEKATIFVVGDTTLAEIKPLLEARFGSWRPATSPNALPEKVIAAAAPPDQARILIVDKPGAPQSLILAGHPSLTGTDPARIATIAMNDILGGQFTARVNMNLREDKGWAYGAFTLFYDALGPQPFMIYAPVQTDKTGAAIKELLKEVKDFKSSAPATQEELDRAIAANTKSLPGAFETGNAVLNSLMESNIYGRPFTEPESRTAAFNALSLADVTKAGDVISEDQLIWVIIGDVAQIKSQIEPLEIGPIEIRDGDKI